MRRQLQRIRTFSLKENSSDALFVFKYRKKPCVQFEFSTQGYVCLIGFFIFNPLGVFKYFRYKHPCKYCYHFIGYRFFFADLFNSFICYHDIFSQLRGIQTYPYLQMTSSFIILLSLCILRMVAVVTLKLISKSEVTYDCRASD